MLALRGELILIGKQPDGDSIRFVPRSPRLLQDLARADRLRMSEDGSVQLRLEGIDAPEAHYNGSAQPLGPQARAELLRRAGFSAVELTPEGTVTRATPPRLPAAILSRSCDVNGRPVAYLLVGADLPADGRSIAVSPGLVLRSLNAAQVESGAAYLTVYTSTPPLHRGGLRALALAARKGRRGVWAADRTSAFRLVSQASIGPRGQLVLPKLFRRCAAYLAARADGFSGTLPQWLRAPVGRGPQRDDGVVLEGGARTRLSALVTQRGAGVTFTADLLDVVFVEQ